MDHRAVIAITWRRAVASLTVVACVAMPVAAQAAETAATNLPASAPAAAPAPTSTAKLVEPADGTHFDHLEVAPMVQFDPVPKQTPRWVLLASDAAMTKTVRYCRQFVWAMAGGAYHWGCNKWATGADQWGNDQLLALEPGKVYYWQVVTRTETGTGELKSAIRSFAVDAPKPQTSVADVSDKVHGTAFDDGTQLNLGASAFVNSGVRVKSIASARLSTFGFRIRAAHVGAVDYSRSYIKITSRAGTRYLRLARAGTLVGGTVWKLNAAERRLGTKRFAYQAYFRSAKNGSLVRSQLRVVLIRTTAAKPVWKPD